ncbi:MAG: hypothetical protein IPL32_11690 [Chloracidobacterium sp.]|nr:hypothetical protein [Chloracidobacterium sp.]
MKRIAIFVSLVLLLPTFASAQVKLSAKIAKRIADATPKSLPQSPRTSKLRTDAEDEAVKGKVKSTVEESEDRSGTWSDQGRHLQSITEFNKNGDYVKVISFSSNGNPYEVKVYGYLDGVRASSYQTIYEDSGIITTLASPDEEPKETQPADPRYSYKYEYKYEGGKMVEMQMLLNNGEKGMRYVYNHSENRMEKIAYGYDGKLNQKYITMFDSKGNEIEWHNIAVINLPEPDKKYLIKNDAIDKYGNWTKRTFLKLVNDNGKVKPEPAWIEYRTITYYLESKK